MGISLPTIGVPGLFGGGALPGPDTVANLAHWYNLDSLTRLFTNSAMTTPVTADGDPVGAWVDQIVAADEVAQATTGAKPTYRASIAALGNKPALQFDGGDYLRGAYTASIAQPYTIFVVYKYDVPTGNAYLVDGDDTTNRAVIYNSLSAGNKTALFAGAQIAGPDTDTAAHIAIGVVNGASGALYVDGGAPAASGDVGANSVDGLTLGAQNVAAAFLTGYIAEAILYSAAVSVANRNVVQAYLAAKYGVSVTEVTT